jgi:hypothetical protein
MVNWLAVLIAGLVHFAIGMIWYSPLMFAKMWMKLTGVSELKPTLQDMIISVLSSLVMAFVLANIIILSGAKTIVDGVVVGIMVEIGFIATLLLGDVIYEKKPFNLFLLRNGYNLIALSVIGALLAVWK